MFWALPGQCRRGVPAEELLRDWRRMFPPAKAIQVQGCGCSPAFCAWPPLLVPAQFRISFAHQYH